MWARRSPVVARLYIDPREVTFGPAAAPVDATCWWVMEVDRNGLEILRRKECLRLMGLETLGRIGLTSAALPIVLPVSFHLDGERIIVRMRPGTRLDAATRDAVVAFEVDDIDPIDHTGWSVAVTGMAHEVIDPAELTTVHDRPRARWGPAGDETVITVSTELMSGRRTMTPPQPTVLGTRA